MHQFDFKNLRSIAWYSAVPTVVLLGSGAQLAAQDAATNSTNISTNVVNIGNNSISILGNDTDISTNVAGIATNASNIVSNDTEIATNSTNISTNASNIVTNGNVIAANSTNITSNDGDISTNVAGISTNASNIVTNDTDISTNVAGIATNASNIVTNDADISTNVAGISTNASNIVTLSNAVSTGALGKDEVGLAGVITKDKVTGEIHIGENSLITNEIGGEQLLYAENALGDAIAINITNGSKLLIEGDLVATQLYADQAEADAKAYTDTREGLIRADFAAGDANLQSQIDSNKSDIERNARGIAMVAALQHTTVLPGMNNALDVGAAHFEGETGMSLNYARRVNENVQFNFGAAATTDFEESVIKAGIGVQW